MDANFLSSIIQGKMANLEEFMETYLRLCKDHHIDTQECVIAQVKRYSSHIRYLKIDMIDKLTVFVHLIHNVKNPFVLQFTEAER